MAEYCFLFFFKSIQTEKKNSFSHFKVHKYGMEAELLLPGRNIIT